MRGVCIVCKGQSCTNPKRGNCWREDDNHELCSDCSIEIIELDPPKDIHEEQSEDAECCTCIWFSETDDGEMCGHPYHIQFTSCCDAACADYETE